MSWRKFKAFVQKATWIISPRLSCTISYYHNRHRWPDFKHPKDLSEIVFNQIISGENKKYADYVDKIKVRDYLTEWGLQEYLPKLYGVWDSGKEIDFDSLPNKFALKSNNFCGGHLFCHDKDTLDQEAARSHMDKDLHRAVKELRESQYNVIVPKIYAEELLEEDGQLQPIDYKYHCCDGEVRGTLVAIGRGTPSGVHFAFYDTEWNKRDVFIQGREKYYGNIEKPSNHEDMLEIAKIIAQRFTQVRVDFYNINKKIYIGELTFTPEGGMMKYYTNKAIDYLGHQY